LPPLVQMLVRLPLVRQIPARMIAYGLVRPRVRAPARVAPTPILEHAAAAT
jgi:hypothetical protein